MGATRIPLGELRGVPIDETTPTTYTPRCPTSSTVQGIEYNYGGRDLSAVAPVLRDLHHTASATTPTVTTGL